MSTSQSTSILFTGFDSAHADPTAIFEECRTLLTDHNTAHSHVNHIFFYFDAVNVVKHTAAFPRWEALKREYNVDLIACSTVAAKRDIDSNSGGPFDLAGLSEFYSRLHICNTLVQV